METTNKSAIASAVRAGMAGLLLCGAGAASAGYITTWELQMETIFSQSDVDANAIDIRFNANQTLIVAPALLAIDSDTEFEALTSSFSAGSSQTVKLFFVDTINWCGNTQPSYIGCAAQGGNYFVLDSSWAASPNFGANLTAHELSHNLGLDHVAATTNLMNSTISSNYALDAGQIATILNSQFVQRDGAQRYISITPIAVMAAVPEPQAWAMMGLGLLGMATWVRRRKECAA